MTNEILIRDATPDDAADIQAMIAGLAKDVSGPDHVLTVEDVKRYGFGADPDFFVLIAEIDGAAAGLAIYFNEFSTWRGRRGVYLQDLYVMPETRGRGVGEELIKQLAIEAKSNGAVYLRLAVDAENEDAARFYERIGFTEADRDRIFMLKDDAFQHCAASE
jgi:ribosomal protein S18 acetylase RimI-like enzyme